MTQQTVDSTVAVPWGARSTGARSTRVRSTRVRSALARSTSALAILALTLMASAAWAPAAAGEEVRALVFFPAAGEGALAQRQGVWVERTLRDAAVVSAEPEVLAALAAEGNRVEPLPDPHRLILRAGVVDLRDYPLSRLPGASPGEPIPLLAALDGPPGPEWIARLEQAGARIVGPVPPSGFLLRADAAAREALATLPEVVALAPYRGEWKVSRRVFTAAAGADEVEVEIATFAGAGGEHPAAVAAQAGAVTGRYELAGRQVLRARLPVDALAKVAGLPEVEWIDQVPRGRPFNEKIRVLVQTDKAHIQANQAFYNPIYYLGVYGAGETVAVTDTGFFTGHEVYFAPGKVLSHSVPANSCGVLGDAVDHGTLVAATVAGDKLGTLSGTYGTANDYDGLSVASGLILQDVMDAAGNFCTPPNQPQDLFVPAFQAGARVHNNSWGHNVDEYMPQNGSYSLLSQAIDQHLKSDAYRENVLVFAAGNYGADWWNGSYYPRSLSDEAHAKNAIAVGGHHNGAGKDFMYLFSSRGPTNDCLNPPCTNPGRVKPDLVASSAYVTSASSLPPVPFYRPDNFGTSFGAPAVSAAAALVRDYFAQGLYPNDSSDPPLPQPPSSALVKAMLVNSTVFLSDASAYAGNAGAGLSPEAYPNYDQGYGRPVLDQVLEPAGYRELKVWENGTTDVAQGEVWQRTVKFPDIWQARCNTLRFTLAWTDEPMTLGAGKALVNDLDLEVIFNGTTYRGNYLHTGGQVFDDLNNVEDVLLSMGPINGSTTLAERLQIQPGPTPLPLPVKATVRVYGRTVLTAGPQPFALVATFGTCFDNVPCPPPPPAGGCYRGPGDVVPGIYPPPPPACGGQGYDLTELDPNGTPFPHCEPPGTGVEPIEPQPVDP